MPYYIYLMYIYIQNELWEDGYEWQAEKLVRTWAGPLRRPEDFDAIAGLGPKTREKCRELLATGALQRLEAMGRWA